jgi:hypothetical protein
MRGFATVHINAPTDEVWLLISDVTQIAGSALRLVLCIGCRGKSRCLRSGPMRRINGLSVASVEAIQMVSRSPSAVPGMPPSSAPIGTTP